MEEQPRLNTPPTPLGSVYADTDAVNRFLNEATARSQKNDARMACEVALSEWIVPGNGSRLADATALYKAIGQKGLRLDTYVTPAEKEARRERKRRKKIRLSRTQLKERGFLDIHDDNLTYEDALILHQLWLDYIKLICKPPVQFSASAIASQSQTLAAADLHGGLVTVAQSKNPSLLGLSGIIVRETERTFQLISRDNKLRTVPKAEALFYVAVADCMYVLHGCHLVHRTAHRSKMKIKQKNTIEN